MSNPTWEPMGVEEAQKAYAAASDFGGGFLKLKQGKNVIRFLPRKPGMASIFTVTFYHYLEIPGFTSKVRFNCPRRMAKKQCPVCIRADRFQSSGYESDKKMASKLFARMGVYSNVIDCAEEETGPQVFNFGRMLYDRLNSFIIDFGRDFSNPMNGSNVIIMRMGEKMATRYIADLDPAVTPLANMHWISEQSDLQRFTRVPSLDEIDQLLLGAPEAFGGKPEYPVTAPARPAPRRITDVAEEPPEVDANGDRIPF